MTSTEYSKGYMAGLADAQKQTVSSLTGNPMAKKVWMPCPACGKESPMADPDAELLDALKEVLAAERFSNRPPETVMQAEEKLSRIRSAVAKAEAAIAKAQGVTS